MIIENKSAPGAPQLSSRMGGLVSRFATEGILVAVATGIGYFTALLYETNYLGYFGIPAFLASPRPQTIVASVFATMVAGAVVLTVLQALMLIARPKARVLVASVLAGFALAGQILAIAGALPSYFVGFSMAVTIPALICIVLLTRERGRKRGLVPPFQVVSLVVAAVGLLATSGFAGQLAARGTTTFYSLKEQRDVLVLRDYGEVLIGVRFDRDHHRLLSETLVIRAEERDAIQLYREELRAFAGFK